MNSNTQQLQNLQGKNILIGITGGIAAYKIFELIRMYKKSGANVQITATPNALNFVTRLTLQTLSNNEIAIEEFNKKQFNPEHISYADWADIFVIAPATANTISKIATGICGYREKVYGTGREKNDKMARIALAISRKWSIIAP